MFPRDGILRRNRLFRDVHLFGCALAAATLAVYAQVRGFEFVLFDDNLFVFDNPHVKSGITVEGLRWALSTTHTCSWHPLTWLSHMADVELFGLHSGYHHLTSVVLHICAALVLYSALLCATGAKMKSVFVAAVFALHPLHVESVGWVSERKDVLNALFGFVALFLYVRYVKSRGPLRYILVLVAFACGLMTKQMILTLPLVFLLLDYWPLRRVPRNRPSARALCELIVEKLPLFVMSGLAAYIAFRAQQQGECMSSSAVFPISHRVVNALTSYQTYILKTFFPLNLSVHYPMREAIANTEWVGALLSLCAITGLTLIFAKRRYLLVGWLWFLGMLVPVIGIIQIGAQSMADRYTYIPLVGLAIMVAWGVPDVLRKFRHKRWLLPSVSVAVLCSMSILTWNQIRTWQTSETLFHHTLQVAPNNPKILNNLGVIHLDKGQLDEAEKYFGLALQVSPMSSQSLNNLGVVYLRGARYDEAAKKFRRVLSMDPLHREARKNLSAAREAMKNETHP